MHLFRRRIFLGTMLGCAFMAAPAIAQVSEWVPIEIENGHVYTESSIGGVAGRALIDTGAGLNGVNEQFLEANEIEFATGRKTKVSGVYGTANLNTYKKIPVTIFGSELEFNDLVGINLGAPSTQMIIGAGFLKLFIFQFDYPNGKMRFISRDSLDLSDISNVRSRRDPQGSSPIVRVELNNEKEVWLIMDTGYNGSIMLSHSEGKRWLNRFPSVEGITVGINSYGEMQHFNLPVMKLGTYEIENPIIAVPVEEYSTQFAQEYRNSTSGPTIRKKAVGVLGYDILRHFVVTVDYRSSRVHLGLPEQPQSENAQ